MPPTRVEQLNQVVRALCVLILLGGFVFGFIWGIVFKVAIIDSAAYIGVLTLALTWWFKSRDEQANKEPLTAPPSPPGPPPRP